MQENQNFDHLELNAELSKSLTQFGISKPTEIQDICFKPIVEGKDVFAQAQTGSGKTLAFLLPLCQQLINLEDINEFTNYAVILSPTRELAQQTQNVLQKLGEPLGIKSTCLIGGESFDKQKASLGNDPHVLVVTPGRMLDLLKQGHIDLKSCHAVIFDEVDRIFDMGFEKDINEILKKCPKTRQLIMLSATSHQNVLQTAYKFGSHPVELKVSTDELVVDKIDHQVAMISGHEKMPLLIKILHDNPDNYALVFCNTQFQTHLVAEWLRKADLKAMPISGRLAQNKRTKLMDDFRSKEITILVCTDVAARGLDIEGINLVINFDIPMDSANYVHRIGRTGRAGKDGKAISFCAFEDCEHLDGIYELLGEKIIKMELNDADFAKDVPRKPFINSKTLKVEERRSREKNNMQTETSRHEKRERKPQSKNKPVKREFDKKTERKPFVEKTFEIKSFNYKDAQKKACAFFNVNKAELLTSTVLSEGKRKFWIFGAKEKEYKFFLRPNFKKFLLPFLIEMTKKANLKLYVNLSFRGLNVNVDFTGQDVDLLAKNGNELLYAYENITKVFLQNYFPRNRDLRTKFRYNKGKSQDSEGNSRNSARNPRWEVELFKKIDKLKEKVLETREPVLSTPLNPKERRSVHQYLSDEAEIETNSKGEGRLKKVEISYIR